MRRQSLLVATHNILDGLYLPNLLQAYRRLHAVEPVSALCIQEAVPNAARRVAAALGRHFTVGEHAGAPRLAIVYDRTQLRLRRLDVIGLPRLTAVPLWQRIYTSACPEPKQALVAHFSLPWPRRQRQPPRHVTLANFHLDAAGDNSHRGAQLRALSTALPAGGGGRLVACGDANVFTLRRAEAEPALSRLLEPLRLRHGAKDAHVTSPEDTHFFARAHEPKLGQRIAVALGQLGIDAPRRYDVVAATMRCIRSGTLDTPASDHNLVWARLAMHCRDRDGSGRWGSRVLG